MSYSHSVITEIRRKMSGEFETPVKIGAEQRFVGAMLNSHNNNLEEQNIMGLDRIVSTWENKRVRYTTTKYYDGNASVASSIGYYILFEQEATTQDHAVAEFKFENQNYILPEYDKSSARFILNSNSSEENPQYDLSLEDVDLYNYQNGVLETNPDFDSVASEFYFSGKGLYIPEYAKSGAKFDLESTDEYGNNLYTLTLDDPELYTESSRVYKYHADDKSLEINPGFQIIKRDTLCFRTDAFNNSDTRIQSDILISEKIVMQRTEDNGKTITKYQIVNHLGE